MIDLDREGEVFVLTMHDGENRWNTSFVRAFAEALDAVESSEGPAALVTASADEKFFSNGLDLEWRASEGPHRGGDRDAFTTEFMALMGRIITFPVPTVAAINGHAFGAGLMVALCHDVRLMRAERGYLCANEMQIGFRIPTPELALFRHKLSAGAFFQTVQLARRWTAGTLQASTGPMNARASTPKHRNPFHEHTDRPISPPTVCPDPGRPGARPAARPGAARRGRRRFRRAEPSGRERRLGRADGGPVARSPDRGGVPNPA